MNKLAVVTGATGFIGTNIYNKILPYFEKVIACDHKLDTQKTILSPQELLNQLDTLKDIEVVFHQGACSDTTCYNAEYMMRENFDYSVSLFRKCLQKNIRFIYASSAAVYGDGPFKDNGLFTDPKNIYAKSKCLFDEYIQCFLEEKCSSQIVGLRYFNVYGPGEHKKGKMASVIHQFHNQYKKNKKIYIFKNSENYTRDFINVEDVVKVNLHFLENESISGIYNCGTGISRSFYDIANIMQAYCDFEIEEVDMPSSLQGKYQIFTQSDNTRLIEEALYNKDFLTLEEGVENYMRFLESK